MTVLVTGGAGYIGSHMVWELLDAGESVVVLDRLSTGFEWAVREDARLAPESPYGLSKLMSEWMLRDAAIAHDIRYTALRYFNVAGADPKGRTGQSTPGATHLIKVACETALGKRPFMQVFGKDYPTPDGTCIRDYIHVSDLAAAHRLALQRLRDGGESLVANCGYSHGYSVLEVIDSVRRAFGHDFDVRMGARRPGDAAAVVANSDLARKEFGWTPQRDDLDQIVKDALAWERILTTKNSVRN
ncbi:MAG: UDP-glucose 4-epimerase [Mesorhizobium sp.]|nr:MAG: UDP-glucose 4-epimerase [Mesorhizobium sp.]